jgi:Ca2+-transporting ATPase
MGLTIIMLANLFLVQVNSSDHDSVVQSIRRMARNKVMWVASLATLGGVLLILYTPLNGFLKLAPLSAGQFFTALGIAAASVFWYEIVKLVKRLRKARR